MAQVIVTLQIMQESPEVNLQHVKEEAIPLIAKFGGFPAKEEIEPVAFGLKALKIYFIMDESKGSTEALELQLAKLPGVKSAETIDVRRTLG